jgi:hypothetical protein
LFKQRPSPYVYAIAKKNPSKLKTLKFIERLLPYPMSKCTRSTNPVVSKSKVRHPDACVRNPKAKKSIQGARQPIHTIVIICPSTERVLDAGISISIIASSQPENVKDASPRVPYKHRASFCAAPCHAMLCSNIRTNSYASIPNALPSQKTVRAGQDVPLTKPTNFLSLKVQLLPPIHAPTSLLTTAIQPPLKILTLTDIEYL